MRLSTKPDQGYAWIVLIASFLSNTIEWAVLTSTTLFLVNFTEAFDISLYQAGWICSVNNSLVLMFSILVGILIDKFDCRKVGLFGSLCASVTFVISSQVSNLWLFVCMYSVMTGILLSCCGLSSIIIIQRYFDKRRNFATGLVFCGRSIGSFTLIPVIGYCIEYYGWRGAMMIIAGFELNVFVCTLTFIPFKKEEISADDLIFLPRGSIPNDNLNLLRKPPMVTTTEPDRSSFIKILQTLKSVVTNLKFILFVTSYTMFTFSGDLISKISTPRAELDMGLDKVTASTLNSAIGFGGLVGRLFITAITNLKCTNTTFMYTFSILTGGIVCCISAFVNTYIPSLIITAVYGIFFGMAMTLQTIVLVSLLGVDSIACSMGVMCSLFSIALLVDIPFAGWMYDNAGSFTLSYLIAGLIQIVGGIIAVVLLITLKYNYMDRSCDSLEVRKNNEQEMEKSTETSALLGESAKGFETF